MLQGLHHPEDLADELLCPVGLLVEGERAPGGCAVHSELNLLVERQRHCGELLKELPVDSAERIDLAIDELHIRDADVSGM
jgi:hypothetical protein